MSERTGVDWAWEVIDRYDHQVYLDQHEEEKLEEAFKFLDEAGECKEAGIIWNKADETLRANWLLNLRTCHKVELPPEIRNEKWEELDSHMRYRLSMVAEDYEPEVENMPEEAIEAKVERIVNQLLEEEPGHFDHWLIEIAKTAEHGAEQMQTRAMELGLCDGLEEDDLDLVMEEFVKRLYKKVQSG